jgi:DNA-binding winged helix-turn-helix (wHTH) protein/TolB-like protein/tetratricopeptide (TPR) repeat protein
VKDLEAGFTLVRWTVIPRQGVLRDANGERRIEPKVMEVLVYLAEHAGDVVTRDELLENVWAGMVVGDEALSRAVSLLRTHLEDDPRQPSFIQTVPRRGYRLIPSPTPLPTKAPETSDEPVAPSRTAEGNWWRYLAGASVMLVLGIVIWQVMISTGLSPWRDAERAGRPISVAVLPLTRQGPIPEERGFVAESLPDEIIGALANFEDVRVMARSSARNVDDLADTFDVDAMIEGSVSWQRDRARINLHLVNTHDGDVLWSQTFESDLKDVFFVQDTITPAVVKEFEQRLGRRLSRRGPMTSSHIPDPEAYELFLRGRLLWKQHGETSLRRSIDHFREAIAVDPDFARAHLALAQAYVILPPYSDESETKMFRQADIWIDAQKHFEYAVEHAPENPELHGWFSEFLSRVGYKRLALEHAKTAQELDTLSPEVNLRLALAYLWLDDQKAASRQWAIGDELGFQGTFFFAGYWRAYLLLHVRQGDAAGAKKALRQHQEAAGLPVEPVLPLIDAFVDPRMRERAIEAAAAAVEAGMVQNALILPMWILLGDMDEAYASFYEMEDTPWDLNLPFLYARESAGFRADPRFTKLANDIGLDVYWEHYGAPDDREGTVP